MQCGPIRYKALSPSGTLYDLEVVRQTRHTHIDLPVDAPIQDVFRHITTDQTRTENIAPGIRASFDQGTKVHLLTHRIGPLDAPHAEIGHNVAHQLVLTAPHRREE